MDPKDIVPFEPLRMFLGEGSPWFMLEIVVRCVLLYGWLLLCLRLVGRRALAQLSVLEFGIVIALGSAGGDGVLYADVPVLHAMVVILVVVILQNGLTRLVNHSERVETFVEGRPVPLVEDGVVNLEGLSKVSSSTEELFEILRLRGVVHLGEVRYAFMEQGGSLSVFKRKQPLFGLPIVPPFDLREPDHVDHAAADDAPLACTTCGVTRAKAGAAPDERSCSHPRWTHATNDDDIEGISTLKRNG